MLHFPTSLQSWSDCGAVRTAPSSSHLPSPFPSLPSSSSEDIHSHFTKLLFEASRLISSSRSTSFNLIRLQAHRSQQQLLHLTHRQLIADQRRRRLSHRAPSPPLSVVLFTSLLTPSPFLISLLSLLLLLLSFIDPLSSLYHSVHSSALISARRESVRLSAAALGAPT